MAMSKNEMANMMNATLTTNEVLQIAGISTATLANWITDGIIPCINKGGHGPGNTRTFDWSSTVACAYGGRFLRAGCTGTKARMVAQFVGNMGGDQLRAALQNTRDKGHTFLAVVALPGEEQSPSLYSTDMPEGFEEDSGMGYANLIDCTAEVLNEIQRIRSKRQKRAK